MRHVKITILKYLVILLIVLDVACSKSGIIVETFPQPIAEVTEISLEHVTGSPSQLLITAKGDASSLGWTNPSLEQIINPNPPQDGIYEFSFVALPPAEASATLFTPIEATRILDPFPEDMLGVRIKAEQNDLLEMLDVNIVPTAYFEFKGPDETDRFIIKLVNANNIQHARDILSEATTEQPSIIGTIVMEQAPYNTSWSYHLAPETIDFFDVAIEVCDSNMRYVEEHLDEVGGAFLPNEVWCPWSSQLTQEISIIN